MLAQKMLTHASKSSCENSGTKVSGSPRAVGKVSAEGRRERTWHRRLKRTTSPGAAFWDGTVAVLKLFLLETLVHAERGQQEPGGRLAANFVVRGVDLSLRQRLLLRRVVLHMFS